MANKRSSCDSSPPSIRRRELVPFAVDSTKILRKQENRGYDDPMAEATARKNLAKPGAALKALRKQRGWTLADVSERTGLPIATLSRVENDRMSLSFEKLVRISDGLQIDFAELMNSTAKNGSVGDGSMRRAIVRAGEGKEIDIRQGNYLYVASELLNKRIIPIVAEVRARDVSDYDEFMRHPGEEYVYVLEGTLEFHTEIYAPVRLEKGDSMYFDSGMAHAYVAVGSKPCRLLSICTASEAQLITTQKGIAKTRTTGDPVARRKRRARS
jgi:transcriptional regulator with XRE-family HTH domain